MRHLESRSATGALILVGAMAVPTVAQGPTIDIIAAGLDDPQGCDRRARRPHLRRRGWLRRQDADGQGRQVPRRRLDER